MEFLESVLKWKVSLARPWKPFIESIKILLFHSFNFLDKYWKHPSIFSCVLLTTRNPSLTSSNTSLAINNERNANKYLFLLSFTQLSIWNNKFFNNNFRPTISLVVFNSFIHEIALQKTCKEHILGRVLKQDFGLIN